MTRPRLVSRCLLAVCALAVVQFIGSVVYAHVIDGYVGLTDMEPVSPFVMRVTTIDRASPVYRDGVRVGDRLNLRNMSAADRIDFGTYLKVGRRYRVPVLRDGRTIDLTIVMDRSIADDPGWQRLRGQFYFGFCGILAMFAVAAVLLIKRPDSPEVAILSACMIAIGLGETFAPIGAWDTMSPIVTQAGYALSPVALNLGLALLATYALRFAAPPSLLRRSVTVLTYTVAAIAAVLGAIDPIGFFSTTFSAFLTTALPALLPLSCALLALRDSRGEERARIAWATGALAMIYVSAIAAFVARVANADFAIVASIHNISFPIAAAGLAYALLGHRLLDVGFTLNRATVFAAVSVAVLGSFSLIEWALGGWLASASRTTNVIVSAFLALALGLAIHPIHSWTDRFVDRIFFRKRHEAETALRTFAKEVTFVTDATVIVERTRAILRARTDCVDANVLLYDGHAFGAIDENDPALVSLRATRETVALHGLTTNLCGEWCFPMAAGGRLLGALVLSRKTFGEAYAPDEIDAIAAIAHGVAVALALLGATDRGIERNAVSPIDALVRAIDALPEAIVTRLRSDRGLAE